MKTFTVLLLGAFLSAWSFAQTDTVKVASDQGSGGNLNNAITTVINADPTGAQLSNTVFKLEPYGFYILTQVIQTPPHSTLHLEGPPPGITQQTALPQIVWTTSGGVTTTYNFDLFGSSSFKHVWFMCSNVLGAQVGTSMLVEDDSVANLPGGKGEHFTMDDCIIDYQGIGNGGGAIEPACQHFRAKFTNTYFRNMTDPHYRYYGRPVSWTYQSTTWHTDTLIFENCTIANVGYGYMQESPEYGDYVSFNHCTFLNSSMFTLESSYWWWLSVTNCIFHNSFLFGEEPTSGVSSIPNGGVMNIDSIAGFTLTPTPTFTDNRSAAPGLQRHILFANCSYSHDSWYYDYLANNTYNSSVNTDSLKIHRMPMMSAKTYRFFSGMTDGQKNFPYMNAFNLYPLDTMTTTYNRTATYSATYDPGFFLPPTNIDSIKGFLLGRWYSGANISWAFNPTDDVNQVWPLNEDLSYSNATLKTAAMGSYPLGDLFHWWGPNSAVNVYTAWSAQANAEHTQITAWLTNGLTGVNDVHPATPATYELSQNYPNPFNPTTDIRYSIPHLGTVSLKIYNLLGQEVATLFEGERQPGAYVVSFDASRLMSGVYFYRLQAGNVTMTKKMVLIK